MRTIGAVLAAAVACLVTAAAAIPAAAEEGVASFVSAPKLKPPLLTVNRSSRGQAPGYIFTAVFQNKFFTDPLVGQGGPMVLDGKGRYIWLNPAAGAAPDTLNLQVQRYRAKPVLTYWDGTVQNTGEMAGTWHALNDRYKQIATITGKDGWDLSGHEFLITKNGTALVTGYRHLQHTDLQSVGGGADQTLLDSGVLEYDLSNGQLVKVWSTAEHLPMTDGYPAANPNSPIAYDPWHINSIDVAADGTWLVSLRNTWAIYKIEPSSGAIDWILGGKRSDFAVPGEVAWAFQHDARWLPDGQISMFDNDCCGLIPQSGGPPKTAPPVHGQQSRGLVVKLDEAAKTVAYVSDNKLYDLTAGTQGNRQTLPNGNVFMGWGQQPFFSEFTKTGKLLLSVRFPDPDESYRAYRYRWTGHPTGRPAAAARPSGKRTRVYMSWNGATQVAGYRIFAGRSSHKLELAVKRARKAGFETAKTIRSAGPVVKVQALDASGHVLATSRAVRRQNTSGNTPGPTY